MTWTVAQGAWRLDQKGTHMRPEQGECRAEGAQVPGSDGVRLPDVRAVIPRQAGHGEVGGLRGMNQWGTYPLPPSEMAKDRRLCLGLLVDVVEVLQAHGFPPMTSGWDLSRLMESLAGFAYNVDHRPGIEKS